MASYKHPVLSLELAESCASRLPRLRGSASQLTTLRIDAVLLHFWITCAVDGKDAYQWVPTVLYLQFPKHVLRAQNVMG